MSRGIVTAGGGHGWETGIVAALGRPGAPLTVIRRCADMTDVLAVAATGQISAAVVSADLRRLDSDAVQQLGLLAVQVVVIRPAGDERMRTLLGRIGVLATIEDDQPADAMVSEIAALLARPAAASAGGAVGGGVGGGTGGAAGVAGAVVGGRGLADPSRALPGTGEGAGADRGGGDRDAERGDAGEPAAGSAAPRARHRIGRRGNRIETQAAPAVTQAAPAVTQAAPAVTQAAPNVAPNPALSAGRVIAVWGPKGAPGRSTVSMGIADRAAADGRSVLLIDADIYGGVLATAFGLLDESAGLAGVCRLATTGRLDRARFVELCWAIDERLTVLTGIARADRWPEVRASTVPVIIDMARGLADLIVIDCAALLETDEEVSFDTMAPRRNGATLALLSQADTVIAVGSADPPGLERLVRGLADLSAVIDGRTPRVVFNRVRDTAASPAELTAALRRFTDLTPTAFLPEDRAAVDEAWRRGATLTATAARSPLTRALDAVMRAVG